MNPERRLQQKEREQEDKLSEVVVQIKRTSKKTKGGDRMSFSALAVVGDGAGSVGVGLGKAPSVRPSIQKAVRKAKRQMITIPIVGKARTIPHEVEIKNSSTRIILKPAPAGTGIRAGGAIRAVLEMAGIKNIVAKRLGSDNKKASVDATLMALQELRALSRKIHKSKEQQKEEKAAAKEEKE